MSPNSFEYEAALSFAGEDRATAHQFASLLQNRNIDIFLDEYHPGDPAGKDVFDHLVNLYSRKARYCVLFVSRHYPLRSWTEADRLALQERSFRDASEYILPVRVDEAEIPGLSETNGVMDLRHHSMESVVQLVEEKLKMARKQAGPSPQSHDLRSGNIP